MLNRLLYIRESTLPVIGLLSSLGLGLYRHLNVEKGSSDGFGAAIGLHDSLGVSPDTREVSVIVDGFPSLVFRLIYSSLSCNKTF
jgi:hypothetical protein